MFIFIKSFWIKTSIKQAGRAKLLARKVPGAKLAELEYRVLESVAEKAEMEVKLKTGRSHQIRASCPGSDFR
jgi:23S rRNA-/tRNA-specific pseudouridylate synthase